MGFPFSTAAHIPQLLVLKLCHIKKTVHVITVYIIIEVLAARRKSSGFIFGVIVSDAGHSQHGNLSAKQAFSEGAGSK